MSIAPLGPHAGSQYPEMKGVPTAAEESMPQEQTDMVQFSVPVNIPKSMITPGPDGTRPIDSYDLQFIQKGAVVTSETELSTMVREAKEEALPTGMRPEVDDSKAGKAVMRGKSIMADIARYGSGFANMSLMNATPAAWAGPVASVAGTIGVVAGLDGVKKAFDMNAYFKAKKARGEEFENIPFKKPDGSVEIQKIPLDDLIGQTKDAAITGGLCTLGSALTAAAGLGGGPACAIASLVVTLGGMLYSGRHAIAARVKKIGASIGKAFHHITGQKPDVKPAGTPAAKAAQPLAQQPVTVIPTPQPQAQ